MAKRNLFSGSRLPPGFRFHPTDVELIMYYLKRKVLGKKILPPHAISDVDIYKYAPWDLQHKSCWRGGDLKWYFFCPAEKKYANGYRMKRSTDLGYWKTTGKDRAVHYNKEVVGMIKTLVFHRGKAPKGTRTDWVMYEYRLEYKKLADEGVAQDSYVLCMLFEKEGPGPKNGAQYGAPFREEDWENDDEEEEEEEVMVEEMNCGQVVASVDCPAPASGAPCSQSVSEVVEEMNGSGVASSAGFSLAGFGLPNNPSSSVKTDGAASAGFVGSVSGLPDNPVSSVVTNVPDFVCLTSSVSCSLQTLPSVDANVPEVSNADKALSEAQVASHDELDAMLAAFSAEGSFAFDGNMNVESIDELNNGGVAEANPLADGVDIFGCLGDLSNPFGFSGNNMSSYFGNTGDFLELRDFADPMDYHASDLWN